MLLENTRRFFSPAHKRTLLQLIVQRMAIAADDQVGRRQWVERVRREWPDESYSGGLAIPLGQAFSLKDPLQRETGASKKASA